MKPNFLVIGDLKAGTTSLHDYLSQHPAVFMPKLKELRYFAFDPDNSYHVRARSTVVRTAADYFSYFSTADDAAAIGEASPNYLRSPVAANNIKRQLPNAKLIVSIRNPAERLWSAYQMKYRAGSIDVPFDQKVFEEDANWIKGNFYWPDLKRYFDLFPRNQIKVTLFDDLVSDPASVAQTLYRFLEIDGSFEPQISVHNPGGLPRNQFVYSLLVGLKNRTEAVIASPEPLRKLWSKVKNKSLERTSIDPQLRRKILNVCRDDIVRTQELIGRDLSAWM